MKTRWFLFGAVISAVITAYTIDWAQKKGIITTHPSSEIPA